MRDGEAWGQWQGITPSPPPAPTFQPTLTLSPPHLVVPQHLALALSRPHPLQHQAQAGHSGNGDTKHGQPRHLRRQCSCGAVRAAWGSYQGVAAAMSRQCAARTNPRAAGQVRAAVQRQRHA